MGSALQLAHQDKPAISSVPILLGPVSRCTRLLDVKCLATFQRGIRGAGLGAQPCPRGDSVPYHYSRYLLAVEATEQLGTLGSQASIGLDGPE